MLNQMKQVMPYSLYNQNQDNDYTDAYGFADEPTDDLKQQQSIKFSSHQDCQAYQSDIGHMQICNILFPQANNANQCVSVNNVISTMNQKNHSSNSQNLNAKDTDCVIKQTIQSNIDKLCCVDQKKQDIVVLNFQHHDINPNFKILNNEILVKTQFIIDTSQACNFIINYAHDLKQRFHRSSQSSHYDCGTKETYQWNQQVHEQFITAVAYLGLKQVTPSQIFSLIGDEDVTKPRIASHLQKYRLKIAQQHQVTVEQLQNSHAPIETKNSKVIYACNRWKDEQFLGFSNQDIKKALQK